ncbi:hypothetical protein CEXT_408651 [Caerostris extrusa]|uniref:Secreted protein n=1 Tax=Caerostris extrusa TaxID=172846 RepID=A0AAV4MGN8_CAEEX|nr:hypothetical protein CEXT_408651 [Caerostris extrusa]
MNACWLLALMHSDGSLCSSRSLSLRLGSGCFVGAKFCKYVTFPKLLNSSIAIIFNRYRNVCQQKRVGRRRVGHARPNGKAVLAFVCSFFVTRNERVLAACLNAFRWFSSEQSVIKSSIRIDQGACWCKSFANT